MVKKEFIEYSEILKKRDKLYKKATSKIDSFIVLGLLIFIFGIIPIIPLLLDNWIVVPIFCFTGLSMMIIGQRVKNRIIKPPELLTTEREFLNVCEALNNLDTYIQIGDDFSRIEAMKILRKIEENIKEPDSSTYKFWNELIGNCNENLRLFRRNLSERLFPIINKGEREPIKLVYFIIEEFADLLINPIYNKLINLNSHLSSLPVVISEKEPKIPYSQKRPIIKQFIIIAFFGLLGISAYYIGPSFVNISSDTSYTTAWLVFATLSAGYVAAYLRPR